MKKINLFWQTYMNLEKALVKLSNYIYITDKQLETFSPYIADLLVQTCIQIEAISKELYYKLDGAKVRGDTSIRFDEDCLKEIDKKWGTHDKVVLVVAANFNLSKEENRILKPLHRAHKRQGVYWEKAYQAVKHDRYTSLSKGNIKALLQAMAALYLLNVYYRNESWITSYQTINDIDVSLGSSIFTVNHPKAGQLWYGNIPVISDSPYIVRYQDYAYQKIKEIQEQENKALEDFWMAQPELKDPDFIQHFAAAGKGAIGMWELGKYRLNKKLPKSLPYEERKNKLLNSPEWNNQIHQQNKPKKAEEITRENIQQEIDMVGRQIGMEIMLKYQKLAWINDAMNMKWCEVKIGIKKDVK